MARSMAPCTTQSWLANDAFGFVLGLMGSSQPELAKGQDEGRKNNGHRRNFEAAGPTR